MNENPTNGKSSPENPAGFNWRVEDKTREFFSGSSKFEVSSSDLRVGTKGGGAGGKKARRKDKIQLQFTLQQSHSFSACNGTAAPAFNLANTSRLSCCSQSVLQQQEINPWVANMATTLQAQHLPHWWNWHLAWALEILGFGFFQVKMLGFLTHK